MTKSLQDMTNEELWQLFPIILSEHDVKWSRKYKQEQKLLLRAIGDAVKRISHIGSTAVPGLSAKPTIDILLELQNDADTSRFKQNILGLGYLFSPQPENPPPHMMFMKGYTPHGFEGQVFHLHVRYYGDWDELYFRDYLIEHPETAAEYAQLKHQLGEWYRHNRDAYTDAKTVLIKPVTALAKAAYAGRYAPGGMG